MDALKEQREKLRLAEQKLDEVRVLLLEVQGSVPVSPAESSLEDIEEPLDPAAEMRALIGCAVRDGLEPLMRTLRNAVEAGDRQAASRKGFGALTNFQDVVQEP